MPVPTFVVAGAARSGTTAVIEALRALPDVYVTSPKEPHYFAFAGTSVDFRGPGDNETINRVAIADRDRYLALYDGAHPGQVARGDGSVSTLYYHDRAITTIRELNPDMRIVILLRDPVDRAFSSFSYLRSRGYEPHEDFRRALDEEASRRAAHWHHLWHYTAMSQYAQQVEPFVDAFGAGVGVWLYEDLQTDFAGVVSSIAAFIQAAPPDIDGLDPGGRVNVSGRPRLRGLHRAQLWMSHQPRVRSFVKAMVPFGARERIRSGMLRSEQRVDGELRAQLVRQFVPDAARLRELTGDPLAAWHI